MCRSARWRGGAGFCRFITSRAPPRPPAPIQSEERPCFECGTFRTCYQDQNTAHDADGDGKLDAWEKGEWFCGGCWAFEYGSVPTKVAPMASPAIHQTCGGCGVETNCYQDTREAVDEDGDGQIDEWERGGCYCRDCWVQAREGMGHPDYVPEQDAGAEEAAAQEAAAAGLSDLARGSIIRRYGDLASADRLAREEKASSEEQADGGAEGSFRRAAEGQAAAAGGGGGGGGGGGPALRGGGGGGAGGGAAGGPWSLGGAADGAACAGVSGSSAAATAISPALCF